MNVTISQTGRCLLTIQVDLQEVGGHVPHAVERVPVVVGEVCDHVVVELVALGAVVVVERRGLGAALRRLLGRVQAAGRLVAGLGYGAPRYADVTRPRRLSCRLEY